ncbi:hypothetical protein Psi02_69270 [Planotetraspora silvatica]|uniref:Uncharacterized protein n=1 Tax=Planotetraspora silvatica TaxID=234614 RepID=A0A8J3UR17_9ACTN|nr:hypothetical protein Psi02_69270 [Planotetraspora silvatica]
MPYVNDFGDGRLWDRSGRPWHRIAQWLDPDEAAELLAEGATWLVQWCDEGFTWGDSSDVPAVELLERMVVTSSGVVYGVDLRVIRFCRLSGERFR